MNCTHTIRLSELHTRWTAHTENRCESLHTKKKTRIGSRKNEIVNFKKKQNASKYLRNFDLYLDKSEGTLLNIFYYYKSEVTETIISM